MEIFSRDSAKARKSKETQDGHACIRCSGAHIRWYKAQSIAGDSASEPAGTSVFLCVMCGYFHYLCD